MEMCSLSVFLLFLFILSSSPTVDGDSGFCKIVSCGKGRCNHTSTGLSDLFLPSCKCDPGWTQPAIGFTLPFLPCVIPNCSFDASCTGKAPSPAPSLVLPPGNSSDPVLHPCAFSLCGEGSCQKTSKYGYRCNCEQGYENLLNMTAGPCVRECSVGADCSGLGISVGGSGNRTAAPSPLHQFSNDSKASEKDIPCRIASTILSLSFLFLLPCIY